MVGQVKKQNLKDRYATLNDKGAAFASLSKGPNVDLYFNVDILGSLNEAAESKMKELEAADMMCEATRLANDYKRLRKADYPSIQEQLDILYHSGVEGLKVVLQITKDKYPKP